MIILFFVDLHVYFSKNSYCQFNYTFIYNTKNQSFLLFYVYKNFIRYKKDAIFVKIALIFNKK